MYQSSETILAWYHIEFALFSRLWTPRSLPGGGTRHQNLGNALFASKFWLNGKIVRTRSCLDHTNYIKFALCP